MKFNEQIHIQKYKAYHFLQRPNTHIAEYSRGKGCKAYICRCMPVIRLKNNQWLLLPSKRNLSSNFQSRSKYTIKSLY